MKKSLKGFTLVEMLIVIVAIGIIGSITMDSLIVDITDVDTKNLKVGSFLELINEEFLNQWNKSELGISIYELFTLISNRVIRKYV